MRWCFDDSDVPVHHDGASPLIPDSARFTLLAIAAHLPSAGRGVKLSGVIDEHEDSGSDDAKVPEVGFLAVKHLEWQLHFEPLTRSPVLEICTHHEKFPLHGRWKAAVCEHTPNHGTQSSPHAFGYIDLLQRVGRGELLDNTSLQVVPPKLLPDVLVPFVSAPTNDAATEGNCRRSDEQLKRLQSFVLVGQQVDGGPLGVLVGYLAGVRVAAYGHWREGSHEVPVAKRERPVHRVVGCLRVRKLLSFPRGQKSQSETARSSVMPVPSRLRRISRSCAW